VGEGERVVEMTDSYPVACESADCDTVLDSDDDEYWHGEDHAERAMTCSACGVMHDSTERPEWVWAQCRERRARKEDQAEMAEADRRMAATVPWAAGAPEAYQYR
tara:strand:- start:299 stop:613 length:315 start_codon:yes stop_codon:yes gene_type:complete